MREAIRRDPLPAFHQAEKMADRLERNASVNTPFNGAAVPDVIVPMPQLNLHIVWCGFNRPPFISLPFRCSASVPACHGCIARGMGFIFIWRAGKRLSGTVMANYRAIGVINASLNEDASLSTTERAGKKRPNV